MCEQSRALRLQMREDNLLRALARTVRVRAYGKASRGDCHRISRLYSIPEAYEAWRVAVTFAGFSADTTALPWVSCFDGLRKDGHP